MKKILSQYQRNLNSLAYFYSGGPHFTDEAMAKAKEIMDRPLTTAKRNLVKELGLAPEQDEPERGPQRNLEKTR